MGVCMYVYGAFLSVFVFVLVLQLLCSCLFFLDLIFFDIYCIMNICSFYLNFSLLLIQCAVIRTSPVCMMPFSSPPVCVGLVCSDCFRLFFVFFVLVLFMSCASVMLFLGVCLAGFVLVVRCEL